MDYRNRINMEYAEFMRAAWEEFGHEQPIPVPSFPEPPVPETAPLDDTPSDDNLEISEVKEPSLPLSTPIPVLPDLYNSNFPKENNPVPDVMPEIAVPTVKPVRRGVEISFYGEKCEIPFDNKLRFHLNGIDEKNVADAWVRLSDPSSVETVQACVDLKHQLTLPDWGYVLFLEQFSSAIFPNDENEARLLTMFLLTQSGYKVRIGRNGDELVVLLPFKDKMYNRRFIYMDGLSYYLLNQSSDYASTYVFNKEFPNEQVFTLAMPRLPELPEEEIIKGPFRSSFGSEIKLNVTLNKNLIDFLNDYPLNSNWNLYADASLSDGLKEQLYPELKAAIEGKQTVEAANILLRFVQKAFEYQVDEEQFGIERALFGDETFYYPFSDCEDRAILYSSLIRDLLGLDVALVYYPGHLATAVVFKDDVRGDHFMVDGKKYTVCDPTYINSNVGMAMPQYKTSSAEIIKL